MRRRFFVPMLALASACGDEPGLVLTIDAVNRDGLDSVDVRLTATSAAGTACEPARLTLTPECLPFALAITPGREFGEQLALVASAVRADTEVARRQKIIPLDADRRVEDTVRLDEACYARCGPDQICDGAGCAPAADAESYLDGVAALLVDIPCLDAGTAPPCP